MDELDRIKKIMQTEELNSAQFAAEIGIQGSTLSHILNGRNNPSLDVHKKILNRFRTISSDWLILGIGSMHRSEKQSQTPTLFDSVDETSTKSESLVIKTESKKDSAIDVNQKKADIVSITQENKQQTTEIFIPQHVGTSPKQVNKIIVYYNDNTFQEFEAK